jgi:hypothetical protein
VDIAEHVPANVDDSDNGIDETEDDVDTWGSDFGELHSTGAKVEREVGDNDDGDTGPDEQESFFENSHERGKAYALSRLYQIL